MTTYYRRDDEVQNGLGQAVPNIAVTYYTQPSLALATVYTDSTGATPTTNPQLTNGLGQAVAYMAAGAYTITYSGAQIQTETFADQQVGLSSPSTLSAFTLTPSPNGTIRVFTLSGTPAHPTSGLLFQSGSFIPYGSGYTISGATLTWVASTPPQTGDVLEYFGS